MSISGSQSFSASDKGELCPVGLGNCAAVAYIIWLGGTGSQLLTALALDICYYPPDRKMVISAIQVPGKWNHIAEGESRIFRNLIELMIDHNLFKQITKNLELPVVDLFASQDNHWTPEFVSWRPEPGAIATDLDAFNIWKFGISTELFVFSFWPDTNVPKEGNAGEGRLLSHCSSREELAIVYSTPIHAYRASSAIASGSENPEAPRDSRGSSPLLPEKIPVSCLEETLSQAIW